MGKTNDTNRYLTIDKTIITLILRLQFVASKTSFLFLMSLLAIGTIVYGEDMKTEDYIYINTIKSANLFPVTDPSAVNMLDMNKPAQINIKQENLLLLEFDELGGNTQNYYVKIFNCNADWSISQLNELQYLERFNEYPILDRQLSYNTRVPYVHYKITLPKVLLSGNYIALVYKNGDPNDMAITKRFIVFEDILMIQMKPQFPLNTADRYTGQQIDFDINYTQYPALINPMLNAKIVLRQNYRWDNAITTLKPSFVDENARTLQYHFFNRENVFDGSNEFRYFDIRSNRFGGQNVAKVSFDSDKTEVYLAEDKSRSGFAYSYYNDFMDGRYIINNYETNDRELQADYVNVTFILNVPKYDQKEVYVVGGFNNYGTNSSSVMRYETAINKYLCTTLLKQGQYNYRYMTKDNKTNSKSETDLEGSFSVTQNVYDVLVYFRPFGSISDRLIGYSMINYNSK